VLIRKLLRRSELCKGGPRDCPAADRALCRECGSEWRPADISHIGACPSCGVRSYKRLRCEACPITRLERWQETEAGVLVSRAVDVERALEMGFHLTLADVSAELFSVLSILQQERQALQSERQR